MQKAWTKNLGVVVAGVAAGLLVFGIADLAGIELDLTDRASTDEVRALDVAVAALVSGLLAWAVYSALKHFGRTQYWPFIGSTVLAVSMVGPSWMADGESAVTLMAMHAAVGIVLVAGFPLASGRQTHDNAGEQPTCGGKQEYEIAHDAKVRH